MGHDLHPRPGRPRPDHARQEAERVAAGYSQPRPVNELVDKLRQEWDSEARDIDALADAVPLRDKLRQIAQLRRQQPGEIEPLEAHYQQARETQTLAHARADYSQTVIAAETRQVRDAILAAWNTQRSAAAANARRALDGPGRLGLKLPAVNRANEALAHWSVSWQPIIPTMPTGHADIARFADRADDTPRIYAAVEDYARRQAQVRHPEHQHHAAEAAAPDRGVEQAWLQLRGARRDHQHQLADFGRLGHTTEPDCHLAQAEREIAAIHRRLTGTRVRITQLGLSLAAAQPEVRDHPGLLDESPLRLDHRTASVQGARTSWSAERVAKQQAAQRETVDRIAVGLGAREQQPIETWRQHDPGPTPAPSDQGIGR
ncbi:MAG: hypothetical protein M3353_03100 [Actinomycetota bacterium]|nr:hypothetical protein [Actinomycetota bacterium]